jgi:two-component system chemotaxis sensor kinase CheA
MIFESHKHAFIEEMTELLNELELTLLELEEQAGDKELIAKVFRALHTVKGSSGMFGYDQMAQFTHNIENVYDHIRNGELEITHAIIDLTLKAKDQLLFMLANDGQTDVHLGEEAQQLVRAFGEISEQVRKAPAEPARVVSRLAAVSAPVTEEQPVQPGVQQPLPEEKLPYSLYLIQFTPSLDVFKNGTNPLSLIEELMSLGSLIVWPHTRNIPLLECHDPENFYISWEILLSTNKGMDAIADVFIFIDDGNTYKVTEFKPTEEPITQSDFEELRTIINNQPRTENEDFESVIRNALSEIQAVTIVHGGAIPQQAVRKEGGGSHHENDATSSIRVSAEKLDELVNLVSELVTIQARLGQIATTSGDTTMLMIAEEVERITWALRDSALNIRMLPIGTTFSKFKRLVRDLSQSLNKEVDLTTQGAETELDKTVIEKLSDPLIHIIRNSIDHGIEAPDVRKKAGKPAMGTVHLAASQSGGTVLIQIKDDGAGINKENVRRKAIAKGLLTETQEVSDSELYNFLFAAGFSTAKTVTNVSGRGVGMDVVKRAIESLRGSVSVESKENVGTTITLKLPLTLAIIDGLLVRIGHETYVLPLSSVEECVELVHDDMTSSHGRNIINIRGEIVPYINLRHRFSLTSTAPLIQQVVIAGIDGTRIGFLVDNVIGQHQTVLKTLGKAYKNLEGISGATILGDGSVALILDIARLAERESNEELAEK